MTKNLCRIAIVAVVVVLSAGCLYESPVPISPPGTLPLDTTLVGVWQEVDAKDPDTLTVVILRFDSTSYLIHLSGPEEKDAMWDERVQVYFQAHASQIGNVRFLNLRELYEAVPEYWFFQYVVDGKTLKVRAVEDQTTPRSFPTDARGDGIPQGLNTSAKLRAFLEANLQNNEIYDNWHEFRRIWPADSVVKK